jgi:hypothetical protein
MVTEAPETKKPPRNNIKKVSQSKLFTPKIYPKPEEKATRKDNLNFKSSK